MQEIENDVIPSAAPRREYPDEIRKEAERLYCSGAAVTSIATKLTVSVRTIHIWAKKYKWERKAPITRVRKLKAIELLAEGLTPQEVNRRTGINTRTLYRWREKL